MKCKHIFLTQVIAAVLAISALEGSYAAAQTLAPRQVAKKGDVEIPAGMHLVRDRAGLRWLLPIGMDTPPEREVEIKYFKAREEPKIVGNLGTHKVLSGPVDAQIAVISRDERDQHSLMNRLPKAFAELLRLEKGANLHANQSNDLRSLGDFSPALYSTFKLPYIPIPKSEMEFAHISDYASRATKNLITFEKGGREYVRMFIHPNYVNAYADLIEKFGIVYHYDALTTSSPRSLIVVDPAKPAEVHWVKVSIHKEIDGSVRINTDKKARRAIIMSEAIQAVPEATMESYGVKFMLEPAALQPKGKISSTIFREVDKELLEPARGTKWIPAFILQNTGEDAVEDLNIKAMARTAGERPLDFVRERIIRPLLRTYLAMGMIEGLPGELHTQNFYYKLKRTNGGWLPTGEVMFKDNDGFRFDTELAMRQGRKLNAFARFDDPFTWGKFSNAIGTGAEGVAFLGSWYYKLIRNVNGFETLSAYLLRAINELQPRAGMDKDGMQTLFDDIAAEEAAKITGIQLSKEQYGFGQDKGLNKVLGDWRAALALSVDDSQKNDSRLQTLLAREWRRLKGESRTSALRRSITEDTVYLLHKLPDGALMIEARTDRPGAKADPVIGFALLESPESAEGRRAHARLAQYARPIKSAGSYLERDSRIAQSGAIQEVGMTARSAEIRRLPVGERCEALFQMAQ